MRMSATKYLVCAAAVALLASCARNDDSGADTARVGDSAAGVVASTPGATTADADQAFLRDMVNHHEGLIQMATAAMTKASKAETQGDAHRLHTKQAEEQKKMIAEVKTLSGETVTPMVMPQHKAMNDSLQTLTGQEYDRAFYRNVITHHEEGIRMTDAAMPRLTKPEIRQMADKMKADQQKEIMEFTKKAEPGRS